jgi:hypothetical protein
MDPEFYAIPWYTLNEKYLAKGRATKGQVYYMLTDGERIWCVIDDTKETMNKRKELNPLIVTDSNDSFIQLLDTVIRTHDNWTYEIKNEKEVMITIRIQKSMEGYNFLWEFTLFEVHNDGVIMKLLIQPLIKIINVLEYNQKEESKESYAQIVSKCKDINTLKPTELQKATYSTVEPPLKRKAEMPANNKQPKIESPIPKPDTLVNAAIPPKAAAKSKKKIKEEKFV